MKLRGSPLMIRGNPRYWISGHPRPESRLDAGAGGEYTAALPMSPTAMATVNPTIQQFRVHDRDTGSPQVQIALLTERINHLSSHFQTHKKDFNSRQGLLKMVSHRRRLLEYLKSHNEQAYRTILDTLHLRK